jgi:hypothetical protein
MSTFRTRFGLPGVISTIALVFAMTGGAFAAKYLITSTNQIKPSVLKKLKGATGPAGAPGAAGAQGSAGPAGANGEKGATGATGSAGVAGAKGATGPEGPEGEPWTPNGTLPVGSTETGAWSIKIPASGTGEPALSFPIPLAASLALGNTKLNSLATGTGNTTNESEVITNLTHANQKPPWALGTPIAGPGIPSGAEIVEIISATEIKISQKATATGTAVSLSSSAWEQCDDGVGEASTAEHPEADSGFLCVFAATPAVGAVRIITVTSFKPGGTSSAFGASTSGSKLKVTSTTAEDSVAGTFAVTG